MEHFGASQPGAFAGPLSGLSFDALGALHKQMQLPNALLLTSQQQGMAGALLAAQAVALAADQAATGDEHALITPSSIEAPPVMLPQQAPAPPPQCLFCAGLGSEGTCGPLRPAMVDGQPAAVHHLCAIWSPGCFVREGSSTYVNLETEARRARTRACACCGLPGASLACSHQYCRTAYHLPCAMGAPGVVLDNDTFEVWCPSHADQVAGAASDEEYHAAPTPQRPRRQTGGGGGGTKRSRGSTEAQRPRTDWQKKDENTWLKVVPPWWCEQRTVHFATKVYKELFRSAGSAVLVDPCGGEWLCMVQTEARNDNRPQYTLRGAFAELWQAQDISAGDTLIFKRDPLTGHIELSRLAVGSGAAMGAKLEEAASELSDPGSAQPEMSGGAGTLLGGFSGRSRGRQEASSDYVRGASNQGSHPNRWMELPDGWAVKTVYKSTLAHQQCPIAGWLFKKLYGRLPGEVDRAPMHDPDLDAEFRFDISFVSAANVHYITGRNFGAWVRESGLQAGEQIRMRKEPGGLVVIQRMPADSKVRAEFAAKAPSRSALLLHMGEPAVAGAPPGCGQELASPPPSDPLDALAAAAGYAGTHGTPALQMAMEAAATGSLPQLKRQRTAEEGGITAELLLAQQELAVLTARRGGRVAAESCAALSLEAWTPSSLHVRMFASINGILAAHEWSPEERSELLRFRAKYAWLDGCGREVAYLTMSQAKADKQALLEFVRAAGQGILLPTSEGGAAGAGASQQAQQPLLAAFGAAMAHASPFAAAAIPVPAEQPVQQQPVQQQQQAGGLLGASKAEALAAASLELPGHSEEPGLVMGLDGANSFNLDLPHPYFGAAPGAHGAVKEEQEQGSTPSLPPMMGPAAP